MEQVEEEEGWSGVGVTHNKGGREGREGERSSIEGIGKRYCLAGDERANVREDRRYDR